MEYIVRVLLILTFIGIASAQNSPCPSLVGIIAGCILGTLAFCAILVGLVLLVLYLKKRKQKNIQLEEDAKKAKLIANADGHKFKHGYDNPVFQEEIDDSSNAEKGFAGYVQCREYASPNKNKYLKVPHPKKSKESFDGFGSQRSLYDSSLRLQDNGLVTVKLQSQDIIGLGFNISGNMRDGIHVGIVHNRGPANESGLIKSGDRIMGVYVSFENMVFEDALTLLSYASPYPVKIYLQKQQPPSPRSNSNLVKRLTRSPSATYDPNQSLNHPRFRSQSMDDLSKIGKEEHSSKMKRAYTVEKKLERSSGSDNTSGSNLHKFKNYTNLHADIDDKDNMQVVEQRRPSASSLSNLSFPEMKLNAADLMNEANCKKSNEFAGDRDDDINRVQMNSRRSFEDMMESDTDTETLVSKSDSMCNLAASDMDIPSHINTEAIIHAPQVTLEIEKPANNAEPIKDQEEILPPDPLSGPPPYSQIDDDDDHKNHAEYVQETFDNLSEQDKLDMLRVGYEMSDIKVETVAIDSDTSQHSASHTTSPGGNSKKQKAHKVQDRPSKKQELDFGVEVEMPVVELETSVIEDSVPETQITVNAESATLNTPETDVGIFVDSQSQPVENYPISQKLSLTDEPSEENVDTQFPNADDITPDVCANKPLDEQQSPQENIKGNVSPGATTQALEDIDANILETSGSKHTKDNEPECLGSKPSSRSHSPINMQEGISPDLYGKDSSHEDKESEHFGSKSSSRSTSPTNVQSETTPKPFGAGGLHTIENKPENPSSKSSSRSNSPTNVQARITSEPYREDGPIMNVYSGVPSGPVVAGASTFLTEVSDFRNSEKDDFLSKGEVHIEADLDTKKRLASSASDSDVEKEVIIPCKAERKADISDNIPLYEIKRDPPLQKECDGEDTKLFPDGFEFVSITVPERRNSSSSDSSAHEDDITPDYKPKVELDVNFELQTDTPDDNEKMANKISVVLEDEKLPGNPLDEPNGTMENSVTMPSRPGNFDQWRTAPPLVESLKKNTSTLLDKNRNKTVETIKVDGEFNVEHAEHQFETLQQFNEISSSGEFLAKPVTVAPVNDDETTPPSPTITTPVENHIDSKVEMRLKANTGIKAPDSPRTALNKNRASLTDARAKFFAELNSPEKETKPLPVLITNHNGRSGSTSSVETTPISSPDKPNFFMNSQESNIDSTDSTPTLQSPTKLSFPLDSIEIHHRFSSEGDHSEPSIHDQYSVTVDMEQSQTNC